MNGVRRVLIAGYGPLPWLAAAALRTAFRHGTLAVAVVETAPPAPVGATSLPSIGALHALIGISEDQIVSRTGAAFKLGTLYQGLGDADFIHVHGEIGPTINHAAYFKIAAAPGRPARALDACSYAAQIAKTGRFQREAFKDPAPGGAAYAYGLNLDLAAYAAGLRGYALSCGATAAGRIIESVAVGEGRIRQVITDTGPQDADLFIDCTGLARRLRGALGDLESDDWSSLFPFDSLMSGWAPAMDPLPAAVTCAAGDAFWRLTMPMQRRTALQLAYAQADLSDDAAAQALGADRDSGPVTVARLKPGRLRRPWVGNCVALGEAAMVIEPTIGADLHWAQIGLTSLVGLFPVDPDCGPEAREYNRYVEAAALGLRDFTAALRAAGPVPSGRFWTQSALSDRLRHKMELFAATGRIQLLDEETFEESDWAWLFLGRGLKPEALEPAVLTAIDNANLEQLSQFERMIDEAARATPLHRDYLAKAGLLTPPTAAPRRSEA